MERVFFLDDADKALIAKRRGGHLKLGFALQLGTVRFLRTFLTDPLDVPTEVMDFVAEQLEIADPLCVKHYTEREKTRLDHTWEIRRVFGLRDFAEVEDELTAWVDARAWMFEEGRTAIFHGGEMAGRARCAAAGHLDADAPDRPRTRTGDCAAVGRLERGADARAAPGADDGAGDPTGDADVGSGALAHQAGASLGPGDGQDAEAGQGDLPGGVRENRAGHADAAPTAGGAGPLRHRGAKPSQLKRHPEARKLATLLATVRHLEAKTVDDGLELLDLLMVTELLGKAQRAADKGTVRRAPKLAKASARLVVAVEVLLEATGWGEEIRLAEVWDAIDMVIPRAELRAAVATVTGIVPPPDAEDDGGWRAEITGRIATVSGFVKLLPTIIAFGANAEGIEVLRAMRCLAAQLDSSRKWTTKTMHAQVVTGPWKRLVFGHPADPGGAVDKNAYTFCVLEQFHRHLKRREIYAETSLRWRNLNAHLLEGAEWAAVKTPVLTAPGPARGPRRAAGHSLGWPGCGLSRGRPEVLPVQAP
ncbi:DUF4158 domain-containing protein [Nonomuraea sp. NPDC048882]|uniref:DUF4158 domain-containing protein n=1 Tax=unclassified Nonomuraea TaxID=2593643 RepID=UPI0033BFC122